MCSSVKVKLCGLRRPADIEYVNMAGADYAGFILAEGRRRSLTPDEVRELAAGLKEGIKKVGVYLDQDVDWVAGSAVSTGIDIIQLHGHETDDYIKRLRRRLSEISAAAQNDGGGQNDRVGSEDRAGSEEWAASEDAGADCRGRAGKIRIIKAFRIDSFSDVAEAGASAADMILLDHGSGGSGESFDWSLLGTLSRPFFLAGGLKPENVAEAVRMTKPYAVDVSSGVETDGRKDPEMIRRFMEEVRER